MPTRLGQRIINWKRKRAAITAAKAKVPKAVTGDWKKILSLRRLWREHLRKSRRREEIRKIHRDARSNAQAGAYAVITNIINLFRREMGLRYNIAPEGIFVGAGSTTILNDLMTFSTKRRANEMLFNTAPEEKPYADTIVGDYPWYYMMQVKAEDRDLKVATVPRPEATGFNFDPKRFVERIAQEKPKLVYLAAPTNPEGIPYDLEGIKHVLDRVRQVSPKSIIIYDVMMPDIRHQVVKTQRTVTGLMKEFQDLRVVAVNSYSKSKSLALSRVGYGLCVNQDVLRWLRVSTSLPPEELKKGSLFGQFHVSPLGYEKALKKDMDMQGSRTRIRIEKTIRESHGLLVPYGITPSKSVSWFTFNKMPEKFRVKNEKARAILQRHGIIPGDNWLVSVPASVLGKIITEMYEVEPFKPATDIFGFKEAYGTDIAERYFRIIVDNPRKLTILRKGLAALFSPVA